MFHISPLPGRTQSGKANVDEITPKAIRLVEQKLKGEEMTVASLRELEEMAGKLEATARKLPAGLGRDGLLQNIARFRAPLAALQAAD